MNVYDYNVNLFGSATLGVVADNPEEADRILKETLDNITVKKLKEKVSQKDEVKIVDSDVKMNVKMKNKNKDRER